jgi:hypothetical protein
MNILFNFASLYRLLTRCLVAGLISVVLFISSVQAVQVEGLYSHQTEVSGDDETERAQAFATALAAVIVKLTGGEDALLVSGVERAISRARDFVEGISYSSISDTASGQTQRMITVDLSKALVDALLSDLGIPIWNINRPSILVWVAIQSPEGSRRLMNPETDQSMVEALVDFADSRGLPLLFPVLDFEDRRNLTIDNLWDLRSEAINQASARYGADGILAGRIHFTPTGELVGLWQFQFQGEAQIFDGLDSDLNAYLEAPLMKVTDQLSDYFALPSVSSFERSITLRVDGIRTLADYAALLAYVSQLGIVPESSLASLDAERVELNLAVLGDAIRLRELIALDRDLLPIDSTRSETELLHYRWTR